MHADTHWLTERPFAHRGLHDAALGIPENSMAAFERAAQHGYPFELDVRQSADGAVVVFHDDSLQRMTGVAQPVEALTARQLQALRLGNTDQAIPLLCDVLEAIDGRVPILLEIKPPPTLGPLEAAVHALLRGCEDWIAVQSFNPLCMQYFYKNAPEFLRGQLSCDFTKSRPPFYQRVPLSRLWLNFLSRPDFISYDLEGYSLQRLERQRSQGKRLLGWTARSLQQYAQAKQFFDAVIFEGFLPPDD